MLRHRPRRNRQTVHPGHPPARSRRRKAQLCRRHRLLHRRHRQHDADPRPGEGKRSALLRRRAVQPDGKGKNVDELRVRVVAFRDFVADGEAALQESSFFELPGRARQVSAASSTAWSPKGGGDAPESGLEAVALAMNSPWTTRGDRRRQVIVVWTDQPAHPLDSAVLPPGLAGRCPPISAHSQTCGRTRRARWVRAASG